MAWSRFAARPRRLAGSFIRDEQRRRVIQHGRRPRLWSARPYHALSRENEAAAETLFGSVLQELRLRLPLFSFAKPCRFNPP